MRILYMYGSDGCFFSWESKESWFWDDFSFMIVDGHFPSASGLTDRWLGQVIVYEVGWLLPARSADFEWGCFEWCKKVGWFWVRGLSTVVVIRVMLKNGWKERERDFFFRVYLFNYLFRLVVTLVSYFYDL